MPPADAPAGTGRAYTFCRICSGFCGLRVDLDGGRAVKIVGDVEHGATAGYTCRKGRNAWRLHYDPRRFLTAQRGDRRGGFRPAGTREAIAEIAAAIRGIAEVHGAESIGLFYGTAAFGASLTIPFLKAFGRALGTHKVFSTITIDQSAKIVTAGRLGVWDAGGQRFDESDVWLLVGTNPLVSMAGAYSGFPIHEGRRAVRRARSRGLKLLVVDPRRTETAAEADLHVQLRPGTDPLLLAAVLHVILGGRLHDAAFCAEHVRGLGRLEAAVAGASPEAVAADVGVDAGQVRELARCFALARRGMVGTGTGPDMGPWSNLNEHLAQCLNVVCGRFPRAGERQRGHAVLSPGTPPRAQVRPPDRPWASGYRNRFGYGLINGELPTSCLPREITADGTDRVRALVVVGGNPAAAIPGQQAVVDALRHLNLLVTADPFPSETARLADYVIAPSMMLERADTTRDHDGIYSRAFAQFTGPVVEPPPGTREDWRFLAELAAAMDLEMRVPGLTLRPGQPLPGTEEILRAFGGADRVSLDELYGNPHGVVFDALQRPLIGPAVAATRFDVLPDDVAAELAAALRRERIVVPGAGQVLLIVRRALDVMNSTGRMTPQYAERAYNPCALHPDQLADLGLVPGDVVTVASAHGQVRAIAEPDATLRYGTASMTHCFGGLPGEDEPPDRAGANAGRLDSLDTDIELINGMPRMTAVPVTIRRLAAGCIDQARVSSSSKLNNRIHPAVGIWEDACGWQGRELSSPAAGAA